MSPRTAALSLLGLAAIGHLMLRWQRGSSVAPGELLAPPGGVTSPAAHRERAIEGARPLGPGERLDPDRAAARDLERLPGVGPGLARRIVEDREARGAFGSVAGLDRVPGIGPTLLRRLAPYLAFATPVEPGAEGAAGRFDGLRLRPGEVPLGAPAPPVPSAAPPLP